MALVGISMGSNQGDRLENLQEATRRISAIADPGHFLVSGIYETEPLHCPPGSPYFLNAVIEIQTELTPHELLSQTQAIEFDLGRPEERPKNAPRTLDLDILYYDDLILEDSKLSLPHPLMLNRGFVVLPLSEIRPEYGKYAAEASRDGILRLDASLQ